MAYPASICNPNTPSFIILSPELRDSFQHRMVYLIANVTAFSVEYCWQLISMKANNKRSEQLSCWITIIPGGLLYKQE